MMNVIDVTLNAPIVYVFPLFDWM